MTNSHLRPHQLTAFALLIPRLTDLLLHDVWRSIILHFLLPLAFSIISTNQSSKTPALPNPSLSSSKNVKVGPSIVVLSSRLSHIDLECEATACGAHCVVPGDCRLPVVDAVFNENIPILSVFVSF